MPLTDVAVRNAKAQEKPYKLADGGGLYLLVTPQADREGGKYWRQKYRFAGKEKLLSIGVYPALSLSDARRARDDAKQALREGRDPAAEKQQRKLTLSLAAENSFEAIAREWFEKFKPQWVPSHSEKIIRRLERDIFPFVKSRPVSEITAPELLAVLRRIETRGANETAHRAHQNCSQVFRYAVQTGRAVRDPTPDLRGALAPVEKRHHSAIKDPKGVGALLRAIDGYDGAEVTKLALRLAPRVFVRPGELRKAEWNEFDLHKAEWRIRASRMKMREEHIVPLSTQAVEIVRELHRRTGTGRYVFPSVRTSKRPMSENTVNAALRRLGYGKDEMTGHGFRSIASTMLNEQGWNRDAIERQLAHAERDNVRASYNYAEHMPERRKMMQAWSDFLDGLASGAEVIPIKRAS